MAALLLLTAPPVAHAQLGVDDAVAKAIKHAPLVAAAKHRADAALAKARQARAAYLPLIDFDAMYGLHWPLNQLPIDLSTLPLPPGSVPEIGRIDDYHRMQIGLTIKYRLFDLARGKRVDAAKLGARSERAAGKQAAVTTALKTRAAFLAALFARDVVKIAQRALAQAKRETRRAELRLKVGTGTKITLAQRRVRVAGLKAQLSRARVSLRAYRQQLALLTGLSPLPPLRGDLEVLAKARASGAGDKHPALLRIDLAKRASLRLAQSHSRTFWPTVSLFASADMRYPRALRLEVGPALQGGVALNWRLFDGLLSSSRAREARARAAALSAQLRSVKLELARQRVEARSKRGNAEADLVAARETLKQNEIYLRVAKAAVASGTGTRLDVHLAQLAIDKARVAVRKALFEKALAIARELAVAGKAIAQPREVGAATRPARGKNSEKSR